MTVYPVTSRPRWLLPIFVLLVLMLALPGCSTKQPSFVSELPELPAELAAPPEKLVAIKRTLPSPTLSNPSR
ncbi:MAG: hypothetical protein GAK38_00794 [Xylophilus sp.]|nr:MAG: hypothetical protein GAK38_00794 [Xylophilus sp.]